MTHDRKISLLTGCGRYLCRTQDLLRTMERITKIRPGGNYGIKVQDDDWALVYQRLDYRLHRAQRVFSPPSRSYSFTGDGPMTIELFPGIQIPGWEGKTEAEYRDESTERFEKNYRSKAVRAKRLLVERHGEELGGRLSGLLDLHDYQETMNEAYG